MCHVQRIFSLARAIFQQPITLNGLVSGIKFPNDIVLKDADFLQAVSGIVVDDINVSGKITVEGTVNNIDYNIACDLTSPNASGYGLILERTYNQKFSVNKKIEKKNPSNFPQVMQTLIMFHELKI